MTGFPPMHVNPVHDLYLCCKIQVTVSNLLSLQNTPIQYTMMVETFDFLNYLISQNS